MAGNEHADYSKKHPSDKKPIPEVVEAVKSKAQEGGMPCAVAFEVAKELNVEPSEVGFTLDHLGIRIIKCQLGLFGYDPEKRLVKPADSVDPSLKQAIETGLKGGRLPCKEAWAIASEKGLRKMQVSAACEALGIKISNCQLGAF